MEFQNFHEPQVFLEDHYDSTSSTPYVSAPSSPGPGPSNGGFFYSAPASPMHFTMTSVASMVSSTTQPSPPDSYNTVPLGYEFDFSARFGSSGSGLTGSMTSADELFLNGQIRPLKLPTHLERPQVLAPLLDIKPLRGRTKSMSPLRHAAFALDKDLGQKASSKNNETITVSASSSDGRSSKKWVFLKGFISSKSEGRSNNDKKKPGNKSNGVVQESKEKESSKKKGVNGIGKRRVLPPSPHELHYTANRAQAEEMRKKTFLPYRQGLLGCLGFSSKGYGAMNGLARAVNHVSSREFNCQLPCS
ncbi:hypothetical protein like AT3G62630 [Hibiscus trionum]|uniref:Uncharacterized protein n=1 Tax=Hibiscus trionum TaxID=183268 RepID=A0A9W7HVC6_HIBTR|nr:hypothetical protein like AT3G62630 [Hibiscus trionum]